MLQRLFVLFIFLPIPPSLIAQHSFSTRVIDHESGEPLIGVTVYFPELEIGGSTGPDGADDRKAHH
jgi:iron complex outermembrane receptor protein